MYINRLEQLDKNEILEPELFRELMEIESDLERQSKASKAQFRAKDLGVAKHFDAMYRAAQKEIASAKKKDAQKVSESVGEGMTSFSTRDPFEQFQCGNWTADDHGVFRYSDKGVQTACKHIIYITKILRNAETGLYKAEIEFKVRGKLRKIIVPREMLASTSQIVKLSNYSVLIDSKTAPYLVEYLSDLESLNPEMITEYMSTNRLGWIDVVDEEGNTVKKFLPYQQDAIFDNEAGVRSLYESIKEHGSRDKWYKLVKKIRARKRNEININLVASFASVLVELCGALPFIVSLWGGTGIGKSVILKLCTSVWADPGEGKYITDAKATNTAMEIRLSILNSLPMTLDDMAQVKNQYDEDFSELIYRWCAGKGRDRSNKELGLNKLTSWRNCTITNGERSLVDESTQGGAINRVIDIEAAGDVLFNGKSGNETVKCIEANYGFAGKDFIAALENLTPDAVNGIMTKYYDLIKQTAADRGVEKEDKQVIPMALILAADELTEEYLFKDGVRLDIDECLAYLKNKGEVDENERVYRYLIEQVAIHDRNFRDNEDDDDSDRPAYENWGFYKGHYVVIYSAKFDSILVDGGFQPKAFLAWAKKKNLVELAKNGQCRKHVSHGKYRGARAVVIRTDYGEQDLAYQIDYQNEALDYQTDEPGKEGAEGWQSQETSGFEDNPFKS